MENKVTLKAKIVGVTSPSNIQRIAKERAINPQDVFVRLVFEHDGEQYSASNKLGFIGKEDYQMLLDAAKTEAEVKITVNVDSEFFYVEHEVKLDDLFKTPTEKVSTRKNLTDLLAGV